MVYHICGPGVRNRIKQELLLLRQRWYIILLGLTFQYVHGIFTQLAYRMHKPAGQPLHDVGFELVPELASEVRWISEALFTVLLLSFIAWSFTPVMLNRDFSTVVLWTRLLTVLVVCQSLRIVSFSSTQIPGPAPHCHIGEITATKSQATVWWQHLVVDVGTQVASSCGDLIFSSHMTFILTGILAYQHYGSLRVLKAAAWLSGLTLAVLIISARKHYTVDVVIAWYTVPMVFILLHIYWHWQQQQQQYSLLPITSSSSGSIGDCCCKCEGRCDVHVWKGFKQHRPAVLLPVSHNAAAAAPANPAAAATPAAAAAAAGAAVAAVVGRVSPGLSPRKQQQQRYIQIVAKC